MREAVIVEGVRTPTGRRNGSLRGTRPDELAAMTLKEVIKRAGISAELVEDVIMGCVSQVGEQSLNIARMASLMADYPVEVPGTTLDRQCGSSQQAVHFAAQAIMSGDMDIVVAGGIENMSRVQMGSSTLGVKPSEKLTAKYELINQGLSAERIAEQWEISREEMDAFSVESHQKAIQAIEEGRFKKEIMPIEVMNEDGEKVMFTDDEGPRAGTTEEVLGSLNPVFMEGGSVTAGNASQISDGASALLIMSREKAEELGLKPRFRIVARTVVGSDPTLMLTGPHPATMKVLEKADMSLDAIDIFEINEAFASVPLFWLKETGADPTKLNPNGGAIALGHPLGASGGRLMLTMMSELERTGKRFGLQSMCEGNGMANATIIERLD